MYSLKHSPLILFYTIEANFEMTIKFLRQPFPGRVDRCHERKLSPFTGTKGSTNSTKLHATSDYLVLAEKFDISVS
ncbi:hypothetical protein RIR_jg12091.t1 [Rhizophagus irregularis DAOM 181602=DAOM 197198]|uniref:Uncharacterized protein n=1 Tax=Rhizophagus irregularis (strain DAOM 181602 / DAOM 197198 / MUCL 43194) TaxID=747089 RepID=U9UM16_RHIID|nr:hypothetical protein RIR_jg12091.t1 [Rhizophagus irregularis DAOM 181602=DAOM 197198]